MDGKKGVSRRSFLDVSGRLALGGAAAGLACAAAEGAARKPKARPDATCGLYCGACANLLRSEQARKPSDVTCLGCKSAKPPKWGSKCKIKACATKRGLEFCAQCKDYPCEKLHDFHYCGRDYRLLGAHNCEIIRSKGPAAWLKERKKRWTCPKCGTRFSWKDETCKKCGAKLFTAKQEADALRKKAGKKPGAGS